ncbi:cold shock domain-containing protein [Fulvivirgaceae bacterium PWU4]|uniref:Cold shock domain-containing protein n=1 Tax=Chryseosolibacter histidini TaxID=2782349 RepID=A0AAP2GIU1_9BACT|nr:cold shock domain-containing protein [Chryseosolibacter histidini]MBT1697344.1 cold shock domain-containing protein [Chryseosolibacter histidini]
MLRHIGTIASPLDNKSYGFIRYNEGESIFFHSKKTLEPLKQGDKVFFLLGEPRSADEKPEAIAVRKIHTQPDGTKLILGMNLRIVPEAKVFLLKILPEIRIESLTTEEIVIERKFDHNIGVSLAIETTPDDEVFFAKRHKRRNYSRFVKNKAGSETDRFTVIIRYNDQEGFYEVLAAYFGPKTPPEPWDRKATAEALPFWQTHALIPHDVFRIEVSDIKQFDPNFFKTFEELQAGEKPGEYQD